MDVVYGFPRTGDVLQRIHNSKAASPLADLSFPRVKQEHITSKPEPSIQRAALELLSDIGRTASESESAQSLKSLTSASTETDDNGAEESRREFLRSLINRLFSAFEINWDGTFLESATGTKGEGSSSQPTGKSQVRNGSSQDRKGTTPQKRRIESENSDDLDSAGGTGRRGGGRGTKKGASNESERRDCRRVACWFYRYDPVKFRNCKKCRPKDIHRLYCDHLKKHVKDGDMDEVLLQELKMQKGRSHGLSKDERVEQRWKETYVRLFNIPINEIHLIPKCWADEADDIDVPGFALDGDSLLALLTKPDPSRTLPLTTQLIDLWVARDQLQTEKDAAKQKLRAKELEIEQEFREREQALMQRFVETVSVPRASENLSGSSTTFFKPTPNNNSYSAPSGSHDPSAVPYYQNNTAQQSLGSNDCVEPAATWNIPNDEKWIWPHEHCDCFSTGGLPCCICEGKGGCIMENVL
ncbi:MAG: hypothetical protein Q9227_001460 [Pyrenula ochraceoflavens]